jgi:outer membrane protein
MSGRGVVGFRCAKPATIAFCLLTTTVGAARAETLADALALAYQSNPTLQQARAQQRALDETYVQARAGWRPTVNVTAADDYERVFQSPAFSINSGGATLNATQPLYTGGRTVATVRAAEAAVLAGRESLRATEASVLQSVILSYQDVLRDQTLLAIRQDDVRALLRVQDEIAAKREVGAISATDVAQIQAQVATAQATLAAAEGQLQLSRAEYADAVGQNPGTLTPPPPLPHLPADVTAAFDAAEAESPLLRQAALTEQASRSRIEEARAAFGPTVAAGASYGYLGSNQPAQTQTYDNALTAQITVTQPLFSGGLISSGLRQAVETNTADRIGVERARRQVVLTVSQAWNQLISAERMRVADQTALNAATQESQGMQAEYHLALRSTLEVLSADEAVRAAQISIATADHDAYVAEATLLGAIGRLEVRYLVADPSLYDASRNLDKVKNKGATPYEPLIAGLDSLGVARVASVAPISAPPPPAGVVGLSTAPAPGPDAPLATASPVTPEPQTASPSTPASVGGQVGAAGAGPPIRAEGEVQKQLNQMGSLQPR